MLKGLKKSSLPAPSKKSLTKEDEMTNDALSALMNLGYNSLQAQNALKLALEKETPKDLSSLIKAALSGI